MEAGFAKRRITPPVGTSMSGWGNRDIDHGCESIHDDVYVRALYVEAEGEAAVVLAYDLLFLGRANVDRFRAAIARHLDLLPRQILLNASHNHAGPDAGDYGFGTFRPHDRLYAETLCDVTVEAVLAAWEARREATLSAAVGRSDLPLSRRAIGPDGRCTFGPNPDGPVYDKVPVCLVSGRDGQPIACLFSLSTHPTIYYGFAISAEYPGVACDCLDEHLGAACAMFLQGVGGDSKPRTQCADGKFHNPDYPAVRETGEVLAAQVVDALGRLRPVAPRVRTHAVEMYWELEPPVDRAGYVAQLTSDDPAVYCQDLYQCSIRWQIERLDRGLPLPTAVPLTVQGIQLGDGLRLVGIEGEACSPLGHQVEAFYGDGVTFPMGYCNGTGLYLVNSEQLAQGGYESGSFREYNWPSPPVKGLESYLSKALEELRAGGVR